MSKPKGKEEKNNDSLYRLQPQRNKNICDNSDLIEFLNDDLISKPAKADCGRLV